MKSPEINTIIEEFSLFDEWEDKYAYLIDLGKALPPFEEAEKTDANRVHGCTSIVWLVAERTRDESYMFRADSDAHIVKGLVALLLRIYSGKTAKQIQELDIEYLFGSLGLEQYLSPSRSNGFFSIVNRIKQLSKA